MLSSPSTFTPYIIFALEKQFVYILIVTSLFIICCDFGWTCDIGHTVNQGWETLVSPTFCWEENIPMCRRWQRGSWLRQQVASCLRRLPGHDLGNSAGLDLWWASQKDGILMTMSLTGHTDKHNMDKYSNDTIIYAVMWLLKPVKDNDC